MVGAIEGYAKVRAGGAGGCSLSGCGGIASAALRAAWDAASITADTALRLSKAFGTTAGFWLNLQTQFDIATAEKAIGKALAKIVPVSKNAA